MDWKICPLMSRSIVDPTGDCPQVIFDEIPCKEADCALWCGDACAIVQIAKNMRGQIVVKNISPVPGL